MCLEDSVAVRIFPPERKMKGCVGKRFVEKQEVKREVKEWGVMDVESGESIEEVTCMERGETELSLWSDHHSTISDVSKTIPRVMGLGASETCIEAPLVPPAPTASWGTVTTRVSIVVLVEGREIHSVVTVEAEITISIPVAFVVERVAGVSAVAGHFQSIFVVEFIADLERPVLG